MAATVNETSLLGFNTDPSVWAPDTKGIDAKPNPLLDPKQNLASPKYDTLDYILSFLGGPAVAKDTRDRRVRQALTPVIDLYSDKINEAVRNNQFDLADKYNRAFTRYAGLSPEASRVGQAFTENLNKLKSTFQSNTALLDSSMESLDKIPNSEYRQQVAGILENLRRNAAVIPTEQLSKRIESLYPNVATSKELGTVTTSKTGEVLSQKATRTFTSELPPLVAKAALANGDLNQNELVNWYREAETGDKKAKLALESLHRKYQLIVERALVNEGLAPSERMKAGVDYDQARQEVLGLGMPRNPAQVSPGMPQNVPQGQPTQVPSGQPTQPSSNVIQGQPGIQPSGGQARQGNFTPVLVSLPDPMNKGQQVTQLAQTPAQLKEALKLGGVIVKDQRPSEAPLPGQTAQALTITDNQTQPQLPTLEVRTPQTPITLQNVTTDVERKRLEALGTGLSKLEVEPYTAGSDVKMGSDGKLYSAKGNYPKDSLLKAGFFHITDPQDKFMVQTYNSTLSLIANFKKEMETIPKEQLTGFMPSLRAVFGYGIPIPKLGNIGGGSAILNADQDRILTSALTLGNELRSFLKSTGAAEETVDTFMQGLSGVFASKTSIERKLKDLPFKIQTVMAARMNGIASGSGFEPKLLKAENQPEQKMKATPETLPPNFTAKDLQVERLQSELKDSNTGFLKAFKDSLRDPLGTMLVPVEDLTLGLTKMLGYNYGHTERYKKRTSRQGSSNAINDKVAKKLQGFRDK